MSKIYKVVFFSLIVVFLNGCGGGDSGNNTNYPLRNAFIASLTTASSHNFTVSGTLSTYPIIGAGAVAEAPLAAATFLGNAVQQQTTTTTGYIIVNSSTQSLNSTAVSYYDSSYNFLGQTGAEFLLATTATYLPDTVRISDGGTLYTADIYDDITFSNKIGTQTVTFFIGSDTIPDSALLALTTTEYDLAGNTTSSLATVFHLNTNNTLTPVSINGVDNSSNITFTFP